MGTPARTRGWRCAVASLALFALAGSVSDAFADEPAPGREAIPLVRASPPAELIGCEELHLDGACRPGPSGALWISAPGGSAESVRLEVDGQELSPAVTVGTERTKLQLQVSPSARRVSLRDRQTGELVRTWRLEPPWLPLAGSAPSARGLIATLLRDRHSKRPPEALLRRLEALAQPDGSEEATVRAAARSLLARLRWDRGEAASALQLVISAYEAHAELGEVGSEARDRQMAAHLALRVRGDAALAERALQLSDEHTRALGLLAGPMSFYRGELARERGFLRESAGFFEQAESSGRWLFDDTESLNAVTARAGGLSLLGSPEEASKEMDEALRSYPGARAESRVAAHQNRAHARLTAYLLEPSSTAALEDAERSLMTACSLDEETRLSAATRLALWTDVAAVHLLGGDLPRAAEALVKAGAPREGKLADLAQLQLVSADLELQRGSAARAAWRLRALRPALQGLGLAELRAPATTLLALAEVRAGQPHAEDTVREALAEATLEAWLFPMEVSAGGAFARTQYDLGRLVDALANDAPRLAQEVARRRQALSAHALFAPTVLEQQEAVRAAASEYRSWRNRTVDALDRLIQRTVQGDAQASAELLLRAREHAPEAARRRDTLSAALSASLVRGPETIAPLRGPAQDELVLVVTPTPGGAALFALFGGQVWGRRLSQREVPAEDAPDSEVASALLAPFSARIEAAARVRVLASGPLSFRAFAMLRLPSGARLGEGRIVTHGADLPEPPGKSSPARTRLHLFADPTSADPLKALPDSITEVLRVAELSVRRGLSPHFHVQDAFTPDSVDEALQAPDTLAVLFAAHGYVAPAPLESGMDLRVRPEMLHLRYSIADVLASPAVPPFVILSICRGAEVADRARANLSLARAFLVRGSSAVIGSPSALSSAELSEVIPRLFEGASPGEPFDLGAALARVQQEAWARGEHGVVDQLRVEVR